MMQDIFIKDIFDEVITGNFYYGYWPEMHDLLIDASKDPAKKSTKFPFIFLHADYKEDRLNTYHYSVVKDLKIYIVASSEKNYTTITREDTIFKIVIYPLYNTLIEGLKNSNYFIIEENHIPNTIKKLHYRRGQDPSKENQLAEFVEVLEVTIPELTIIKRYSECQ